jgi:hypothetical protein
MARDTLRRRPRQAKPIPGRIGSPFREGNDANEDMPGNGGVPFSREDPYTGTAVNRAEDIFPLAGGLPSLERVWKMPSGWNRPLACRGRLPACRSFRRLVAAEDGLAARSAN